LADTKSFDEPVQAVPDVAPAVVSEPVDLPLAADLTVEPPVEPPVEQPVEPPVEQPVLQPVAPVSERRRPSIRRQNKTAPVSQPAEAAPLEEPVTIQNAEPLAAETVEAPIVEAEIPVEAAAAEEPVAVEAAAPVEEPVLAEAPVVTEEATAVEEPAPTEPAPKPRGRRKSPVIPVVMPEAAEAVAEPAEAVAAEPAEAEVAESAEASVAAPAAAATAAAGAAAAVGVTAVEADKVPDASATTEPEDGSWWDERPGDDATEDGDETPAEAKPKRKWSRSSLLLLLLAILLVVGAAVTGGIYWYKQAHTVTFVDMNGKKVIPDDNSVFDPAYVQAADAQPDVGQRFKVPSVSLDVPLGSVNQVNGLINPPGFTSVYWVKNMGVSLANADKGTVYVVTHAVKAPGEAPGDYMIDQTTTTVKLKQGDEIDVGDRKYTVDSSMTVSKDELGSQTALWAGTPGMLVLITCMQGGLYLPNGHSATNVVIIGTLVS